MQQLQSRRCMIMIFLEIIRIIKNKKEYINPKLFISLLEEYFKCNIYVFTRKEGQNIMIPRHIHSYYKDAQDRKCILIYENLGSSANYSVYPRCELIVKWEIDKKQEENVNYYYPSNSRITKGIKEVFNRITKSYTLNKELNSTIFPIKNLELNGQYIDSCGKCRAIWFIYKDSLVTILTSPIQPRVIKEDTTLNIQKISKKLALIFVKDMDVVITGQIVQEGILKEIHGLLGNVSIIILVNDSKSLDNVPIKGNIVSIAENTKSKLNDYNKNKKLARYILEYIYWLFSRYVQEVGDVEDDLTLISSFVNAKIKIINDFKYENISKKFSLTSGLFKKGKLIVTNEEMLKRLVYNLRVSLREIPAENIILLY